MKRLRRILLNAATALSLLLCLATTADWVNSYWRGWSIVRDGYNGWAGIGSDLGGLYWIEHRWSMHGSGVHWHFWYDKDDSPRADREGAFGTTVQRWKPVRFLSEESGDASYRVVVLPHWVVVTTFGAFPLLRFRSWRRHRRRAKAGRCAKCGYDLRATPERCPECGTVPT